MSDSSETPTQVPKPGDEIAGVKVIDPVSEAEKFRADQPVAQIQADEPPARKRRKKDPASELSVIEIVREKVEKCLDDESIVVEVISAEEHPRGPVVAVKRTPDVTRPVAYIDSGNNWSDESGLSLNIYGFLDSGAMEAIQGTIKSALGIPDSAVSSYTRF